MKAFSTPCAFYRVKRRAIFFTVFLASHLLYSSALYASATSNESFGSLSHCPSPRIENRQVLSQDDVKVEDITTQGCDDTRISAYLVGPTQSSSTKQAAILYVHWYEPGAKNSNRDEFLDEAKNMAKKGVTSLLVSTFWSVPGGTYKQRRWQDDYENTRRQTNNLLQALRLLRSLPHVDKQRMAYVGHDYGATFGAMIAGIDNKVSAFNLIAGTPRITEWYLYGSASGIPDGQAALIFLDSFKPIEPHVMIAKSTSKIFLQYALRDDYISLARAEEMHRAAPANTLFKTYDTTHDMSLPEVAKDRNEWLTKTLQLKTR